MKEKTSITLSSDILVKVDRMAGSKLSRSAVIEQALRDYFDDEDVKLSMPEIWSASTLLQTV